MARKASTPSYTVEYALSFDDANPSSVLDKLNKVAIAIYNDILNEGLKRLHKVQHAPAYKSALAEYRKLCRKTPLSKADVSLKAQLTKIMNDACEYHGFNEYALHAYAKTPSNHFKDKSGKNMLSSGEVQKLATRAYLALERIKFGKAKHVRFCNSKNGLILV